VYSICIIVLGNTFYYILTGPLQNLDVIYKWVNMPFFYVILQADLQCGIFYWITGFTLSFSLLKKIHQNDGHFWTNPIRIFLERYWRLTPLYVFMILFLWKFISLTGGEGPMFYQYEEGHGCKEYFFWHLFMMNNIWPWGEKDYCLHQSWYLANDMWFLVPCIFQAGTYYRNRKWFYRILCFQTCVALAC
jgi:peptidoglycan/LPS O-acetylase OafA/YrhL